MPGRRHQTITLAAGACAGLLTLAGCDKATPEPGDGAAGLVAAPGAQSVETPHPTADAGGPAGQTPAHGEAGQAETSVPSQSPAEAQSRAAH